MTDIENQDRFEFDLMITSEKYYNPDSCWGSYIFQTKNKLPHAKSLYDSTDENNNPITISFSCLSGKMQHLSEGVNYHALCEYTHHPKYGDQYCPLWITPVCPKSTQDQLNFLKVIIPDSLATQLIQKYPNLVNDIIEGKIDSIDYTDIKGMGEPTWLKVKDKIFDNYIVSDILTMLKPLGVSINVISKLIHDESNPSLLKQKLTENPYYILKIKGLGFKKVDDLALKIKPELVKSIQRLVAYTDYYFSELGEDAGHTWTSLDILKRNLSTNVSESMEFYDQLITNKQFLFVEDNKVGLARMRNKEEKVFSLIKIKASESIANEISNDDIDKGIKQAETEQKFSYTPEQEKAIRDTINSQFSIITGCAGCGKTSILRGILKVFSNQHMNISAMALSAMAAKRIEEATGYTSATIHRTLGASGFNEFKFNKDNHLISDVVLLDEASMVNVPLFLSILESIGDKTRVIICGDHKQLPPIGYGNIFSDLLSIMNKKYVHKLSKPMRQALKSGILSDANKIRESKNPITEVAEAQITHGELKDMHYMFRNNREQLFNIAVNTFVKTVAKDGLDSVSIIVPRKQDALNSTRSFNIRIQDELIKDDVPYMSIGTLKFKLGAKVMQTVNDYDKNVFNGEMGYIIEINDKSMIVKFNGTEGNKMIEYKQSDLSQLDLAYAITVHKSQGSGINTVIGVIDNTHFKLLDNCLLYTLLTRAKKRCLLLAEPQAFIRCIQTSNNKRNTWLSINKR